MKKKSIIGLFVSLLGFGMTTTSCEDMLTPDMDLYTEGFSGRDTVNFYFGILSNIQDMVENNVLLGDIRSDLVDTTDYVSDTVAQIANFEKVANSENGLLDRSAYYKVINQCNFYLAKCDTTAQKNYNYYMKREYAQVQMVRAWTYMQLVQNYGSVPFITDPIDNADTGWETNPPQGFATPETLLGLLLKNGLGRAHELESDESIGRPNYGNVHTGKVSVPHRIMVFQGDVIMGDLYLLRGQSTDDYKQAAQYYYNFMKRYAEDNSYFPKTYASISEMTSPGSSKKSHTAVASSWYESWMDRGNTPTAGAEIVTSSVSAANTTFGTVLTRGAQIYGFDPSSSSSSTTTYDSDGNPVYNTSGTISLTANYKNRQLGPSKKFTKLAASQSPHYTEFESDGETMKKVSYADDVNDARYYTLVNKVSTDVGKLPFIATRAYGYSSSSLDEEGTGTNLFSFNYVIPIYRMRQVYLRYAEAVNRAGFPGYAFAVLRDGLCDDNIPSVRLDSIDSVANKIRPYATTISDGASYISVNELRRAQDVPWLDFSETYWTSTSIGMRGIHELGSGHSGDIDTVFTYAKTVSQRMAEEEARIGAIPASTASIHRRAAQLMDEMTEDPTTGEGNTGDDEEETSEPTLDDPIPASQEENIGARINAVESLIADEMALECAFQGSRFYDLSRIARHKNNDQWGYPLASSTMGTSWFAWSIARRSENLAPYEQPGQYNTTLYTKLLNMDNWYLQNPE